MGLEFSDDIWELAQFNEKNKLGHSFVHGRGSNQVPSVLIHYLPYLKDIITLKFVYLLTVQLRKKSFSSVNYVGMLASFSTEKSTTLPLHHPANSA